MTAIVLLRCLPRGDGNKWASRDDALSDYALALKGEVPEMLRRYGLDALVEAGLAERIDHADYGVGPQYRRTIDGDRHVMAAAWKDRVA